MSAYKDSICRTAAFPTRGVLIFAVAIGGWTAFSRDAQADDPAAQLTEGWRKTVRLTRKKSRLYTADRETEPDECTVSVKLGWLIAERRTAEGDLQWQIVLAKADEAEPPEITVVEDHGTFRLSFRQGRYFIRDDEDSLRCLRQLKADGDSWPRLTLPPSNKPGASAVGLGAKPRMDLRIVDSWVVVGAGPAEEALDCLVRLNHRDLSKDSHIGNGLDPVNRAIAGDKFLVDDGEMLFAERAEEQFVERQLEQRDIRAKLIGAAAPEISGKILGGPKPFNRRELKDDVTLIVFFVPWRTESAEQLKLAQELYEAYREEGLAVIGIYPRTSPDIVERLVRDQKLTFPIVDEFYTETFRRYGVERPDVPITWPISFLVDRDGKVRLGYLPEPPSHEHIERLLDNESR